MAVEPDVTGLPDRWTVQDRFHLVDLGGDRSVVVDLDRLSVHEIVTAGADLLRRGRRDRAGRTTEPQAHRDFLRTALDRGWIRGDDRGSR